MKICIEEGLTWSRSELGPWFRVASGKNWDWYGRPGRLLASPHQLGSISTLMVEMSLSVAEVLFGFQFIQIGQFRPLSRVRWRSLPPGKMGNKTHALLLVVIISWHYQSLLCWNMFSMRILDCIIYIYIWMLPSSAYVSIKPLCAHTHIYIYIIYIYYIYIYYIYYIYILYIYIYIMYTSWVPTWK